MMCVYLNSDFHVKPLHVFPICCNTYPESLDRTHSCFLSHIGHRDFGYILWSTDYEDPKFDEKVMTMFEKVKPLYQELHAYVRDKLSERYPGRFDPKGPIPAHLFGNPWAQQWTNISVSYTHLTLPTILLV